MYCLYIYILLKNKNFYYKFKFEICYSTFNSMKRKKLKESKLRFETWLTNQSENFFMRVAYKRQPETDIYNKLIEIYLLRILPKLKDWDSALEFLKYNDLISSRRKEVNSNKLLKYKYFYLNLYNNNKIINMFFYENEI